MKKLLCCCVVLICNISIWAQSFNYPIVHMNGKDYYSYTVEPKDGLYAIARKFGVSQADIHACNKELENGLHIGQVILVPMVEPKSGAQSVKSSAYVIHEVLPKETLYSLSHQYGVSIEDILANNSDVSSGLKVGMKLKIPVKSTNEKPTLAQSNNEAQSQAATTSQMPLKKEVLRKHVVQKKETLYSIARQYHVSVDDVVKANNTRSIKVGDELVIPNASVEPEREPAKPEKASMNVDQHTNANDNKPKEVVTSTPIITPQPNSRSLRMAILLPFMLETPYIDASVNYFWDFYRGALISLEELKQTGVSVELYVYDIEKSTDKLDSILQLPVLKTMDVIIGPAYANQVPAIAEFAHRNRIYTVIPFTSKLEAIDANEYILQFNPSQEMIFPLVARTLVDRFQNNNFVIARVGNKLDKANALANEIKELLDERRKPYVEINLSLDNIDTLQTLVGRNRTLLILATTRLDIVAGLLPKIEAMSFPFLQIWGFEDWKQWTTFHEGTYYYSLFNKQDVEFYESRYKYWYGERSAINSPMYDLIGYDVIKYSVAAMKSRPKNAASIPFNELETNWLQSKIKFQKIKEWPQWVNMNWFLFGYYNSKITEIK